MAFTKEDCRRDGRILLIFSKNACLRKNLPGDLQGKYRFTLASGDTGLSKDLAMELLFSEESIRIDGKELSGNAPFYFYIGKNEKLLLLLSESIRLKPGDKVLLKRGETFKVGSAFKNQIFFDCFSLVGREHAEIRAEETGNFIENNGNEGVYLNEKAFAGKRLLQSGDRVDIYGLHLLVLQEIIVCISFCGICRIASRHDFSKPDRYLIKPGTGIRTRTVAESRMERLHGREERLYTGEMEILLPEIPAAEHGQPLFLSLGPGITMVFPMLLMAFMMNQYMEGAGGGFYYLSALMSGCSALLALFWGVLGHGYGKHAGRRERKEKERQYMEYLDGIKEELLQCQSENRRILEGKYPSVQSFLMENGKTPAVLWNRYYRQKDFLFFRLGIGDIPFQMGIKLSGNDKSIVQRRLTGEAARLAERFAFLKEAPVGVNLYENRQIGIWGNQDLAGALGIVLTLLMQTALSHCYTEVKTVCFYHKDRSPEREIADCFRWLPHSWSADKETRFLAGSEKEAGEILPVLTKALTKEEGSAKEGISIPWYIFFVFNEELIQGEPLYRCVTEPQGLFPASAVFVGEEKEALPKCCRLFVTKQGELGEILNLGNENAERKPLCMENGGREMALRYIRGITGFRVRETAQDGRFPEKTDFLQLYGCRRVEEIESGIRWKTSETGERLKVPIGFGVGGRLVSLDVHEKFHGPHGLVAGTTGSGKSELLQTYLLSIAVNFSPKDVNFFMIDYKGGGTGNLLKSLPHCAGVISNLSGKQIRRAMSAIASENRRRQLLLSDFHVNHIDAYTKLYRKGETNRAMPHLLLVVDEFAELKKEEPEFMQEIISLAQVGRSLGVHLILATQKPAGTVDDKIWSNARFRLCLRVQDRQDSLDMLHSDEAAALTAPGQCYLQIGNHEYFELFKAAYCGAAYREGEDKCAKAVLVSDTGKRMENKQEDKGVFKSQMEVLTDYIQKTAKEGGYLPAQPLYLPELPDRVYLAELKKRERGIFIGLCDDPENQRSFPYAYEPRRHGHLAVCGGPATGKTAFLETILWQIGTEFSVKKALFLAVDLRREGIGSFAAMPHCIGVLKEKRGKDVFFFHLEERIKRRKNLLSGISFEQYNQSGKGSLPCLFLVVDNYGALKSLLEDGNEELLMKLASEGPSLGVFLVISASNIGDMGGKLYEKIKTAVSLEMSDRFQYGDILRQYYIPVLPKENQKGRGLCKVEGRVLELQTALFDERQTGYGRAEMIWAAGKEIGRAMEKEGGRLPEKFPEIPEKPTFCRLAGDFDWEQGKLPLGYCLASGALCSMEPEKIRCFLVSGTERCGKKNLLCSLAEGMIRLGNRVVVLDFEKRLKGLKEREGVLYLESAKEAENWRLRVTASGREGKNPENEKCENAGERDSTGGKICVFIGDMGRFCAYLYQAGEEKRERTAFWEKAAGGDTGIAFMAGIYHPERDYEAAGTGFFREFTAWRQGIHLGGNAAAQRVLAFDDLSYAKQNQPEPAGIGYFKERAGDITRRLLLPLYEREGERK